MLRATPGSADVAEALQREDHLVHGRRAELKMSALYNHCAEELVASQKGGADVRG